MTMANWIKAADAPKEWEGTYKLKWAWGSFEGIDFVPPGFSRRHDHCDGFYYADLPEPPTT